MAFDHLINRESGNFLAPSGVVLSGPLPAVICFGPDDQFALTDDRCELQTPEWTGETIGGADMVDTKTALMWYHGRTLGQEMFDSMKPLCMICGPRNFPPQLEPNLFAPFLCHPLN